MRVDLERQPLRLRLSRFCRRHVCRYTWEVANLRTKDLAHHEPAILQGARRVRYLKLIALFKIGKGVLLLVLGVSLLFLNARARWMDALSNWTEDEILLSPSVFVWLGSLVGPVTPCAPMLLIAIGAQKTARPTFAFTRD